MTDITLEANQEDDEVDFRGKSKDKLLASRGRNYMSSKYAYQDQAV
jgi:hypothetical protein